MWSLPALVLVLLAAVTPATLAAPPPRCGRHLADLLAIVCNGSGYNNPLHHGPSATGGRSSRDRRGVVEECCRKGCSYSTLQEYCVQPSSEEAQLQRSRDGEAGLVRPAGSGKARHRDASRRRRGRRRKKGRRRNGKCRCAARSHRGRKSELERVDRALRDAPAFQIGTVAPLAAGDAVIAPRLRR